MTSQELYSEVNAVADNIATIMDRLRADIEGGANDWQPELFTQGGSIEEAIDSWLEAIKEVVDNTDIATSETTTEE